MTRQLDQTEQAIKNLIRAIEAGILTEETKQRMDELTTQKAELKAAIADRELARGFHLQREHIAFFLYELRKADHSDREVQKRLIQTFVNAVFVFDDCVKITFNYSGNGNAVTLKTLQAAESGEVFGRRALCSTKAKSDELLFLAFGLRSKGDDLRTQKFCHLLCGWQFLHTETLAIVAGFQRV